MYTLKWYTYITVYNSVYYVMLYIKLYKQYSVYNTQSFACMFQYSDIILNNFIEDNLILINDCKY